MRKSVLSIIVLLIISIISTVFLAGCNKEPAAKVDHAEYELWLTVTPTATQGVIAIDETMSPLEMFNIANDNTSIVEWNSFMVLGNATTQVKLLAATIDVVQSVATHKIIDNVNNKFYISTASATVDGSPAIKAMKIAVLEKTYKDSDGKIYFKEGNKPTINSDGVVVSDSYKKTETFTNVQDYMVKYVNNPFIYGMYEINDDTIIAEECSKVRGDGFWTVTITLDPYLATEEYVKVMEYMIGVSASVEFLNSQLIYEIWDNGLIRSTKVVEEYDMNILSGAVKGNVALDTKGYYTYDSSKFDITEYQFS